MIQIGQVVQKLEPFKGWEMKKLKSARNLQQEVLKLNDI